MAKIGRNKPCPCGSGKKFKKCCGSSTPSPSASPPPFAVRYVSDPRNLPPEILLALAKRQEDEAVWVQLYGHVRRPIFADHQGYKVVAVGRRLVWSKTWKTFPDFLFNYVAAVLGKEWGDAEIGKPIEGRHPIVEWYRLLCEFQAAHFVPNADGISESIASGPVMAYLWLAWDLYTLEHHALLQDRLVNRLKIRDQFQGARYEVSVAASFVRAGFDVDLEDETDGETSHCEFTATRKATGQKFSAEAKSRHRDGYLGRPGPPKPQSEIDADVYRLLQGALQKRADHQRIVFIDLNLPPDDQVPLEPKWLPRVAEQMRRLEDGQEERPYPPAFVVLTNHPYHYVGNDQPEPGRRTVFTTFNMPAFKGIADPAEAAKRLERDYSAITILYDSIVRHIEIPRTFD